MMYAKEANFWQEYKEKLRAELQGLKSCPLSGDRKSLERLRKQGGQASLNRMNRA
jgi:hypothetical protein